jgi:hypothetical protein
MSINWLLSERAACALKCTTFSYIHIKGQSSVCASNSALRPSLPSNELCAIVCVHTPALELRLIPVWLCMQIWSSTPAACRRAADGDRCMRTPCTCINVNAEVEVERETPWWERIIHICYTVQSCVEVCAFIRGAAVALHFLDAKGYCSREFARRERVVCTSFRRESLRKGKFQEPRAMGKIQFTFHLTTASIQFALVVLMTARFTHTFTKRVYRLAIGDKLKRRVFCTYFVVMQPLQGNYKTY